MSSSIGCEKVSNVRTLCSVGARRADALVISKPPSIASPKNMRRMVTCAVSRQLCPDGVLRVRRGDQGRPAWLGNRRGVVVLTRPRDRVPRPPEVVVVLVVPAVDRRIRPAQVLQCQEPCAVGGVEVIPRDELSGDFVPAQDGRALPPLGDVRLVIRPGGEPRGSAEILDLVELPPHRRRCRARAVARCGTARSSR